MNNSLISLISLGDREVEKEFTYEVYQDVIEQMNQLGYSLDESDGQTMVFKDYENPDVKISLYVLEDDDFVYGTGMVKVGNHGAGLYLKVINDIDFTSELIELLNKELLEIVQRFIL